MNMRMRLVTLLLMILCSACGQAPIEDVSGQSADSEEVDDEEVADDETDDAGDAVVGCCCAYAVDAVSFAECDGSSGLTRVEHADAEEAERVCIENACQ